MNIKDLNKKIQFGNIFLSPPEEKWTYFCIGFTKQNIKIGWLKSNGNFEVLKRNTKSNIPLMFKDTLISISKQMNFFKNPKEIPKYSNKLIFTIYHVKNTISFDNTDIATFYIKNKKFILNDNKPFVSTVNRFNVLQKHYILDKWCYYDDLYNFIMDLYE